MPPGTQFEGGYARVMGQPSRDTPQEAINALLRATRGF